VGAVHDAGPAGCAAGELDRGLGTFCPGIRKKNLVQIGHVFQQTFGEHARQRGDVKLHQIGQVAVEDTLQCAAQCRMIAANRKNAKTAQ
jgi:hypothetical protein